MNSTKFIVYLGYFIDILGLQILVPIVSDLNTFYGVETWMITFWMVLYAVAVFFSAPILGQLADRFGRKPVLLFCIAGTLLSYLMLFVPNVYMYLFARLINGITGGNMSILQTIMSDLSPSEQERKQNFANLMAIFWIGWILGPLITSILVTQGLFYVFGFWAVLSAVEMVLIVLKYRETNKVFKTDKIRYNSFWLFQSYLTDNIFKYVLWSFVLIGTAQGLYYALLPIVSNTDYGFNAQIFSYILIAVGVVQIINQYVLIKMFWSRKFTNKALLLLTSAVSMVIYGFFLVHNVYVFLALNIVNAVFTGLVKTIYQVEIVGMADQSRLWEINGVVNSLWFFEIFLWAVLATIGLKFGFPGFLLWVILCVLSILMLRKHQSVRFAEDEIG